MAEDKGTRTVTEFPEAKGKTIESIQVYVAADHFSANVNFTDRTAIVLSMEPSINMFPYYGDWTTGERKILKEWQPIKSISLKV
ncbi:MAG TPA: hypothetical protein VG488_11735 [Candidatus Angelobacter sp.]|jgi:hypothetical protein|nr:hypothetical protein [Candidatus Angelobacter sp.]